MPDLYLLLLKAGFAVIVVVGATIAAGTIRPVLERR